METPENGLVRLDASEKEPTLVVDPDLLQEAMAQSTNPEALQETINNVVSSINQKADDYLDISIRDKGEFDADKVNAENGMQAIAEQLNKAFANFLSNEKATTDGMISDIRQVDGKVADILFDYRDPTLAEAGREIVYGNLPSNTVAGSMKYPGTKRVK